MYVIVRANESGVWFGFLDSDGNGQPMINGEWKTITLTKARRCWSWEGARSCSFLATTGPTGGEIDPPVNVTIAGWCEVIECTPKAIAAFEKIP